MGRILIVDDNPKNIQLLGNVLTENNFEVEYVLNGEDALDMLESECFDLILMDIMMPGMDGFETCQKIKHTKAKDIPLVFLTAMNEIESISKGFEVGGVDYLSKPFNTPELLARIRTHIALKQSKDELQELNQSLERKVEERTEELVVVNDKLSRANMDLAVLDQSKNEFLTIINHEIRTPLNGIIGFVNVIKASIKDEIILEMINQLDESCKRLEAFSLQALDISNLNSRGQKALNLVKADINNLINQVVDSQAEKLNAKKIELDYNIESKELNVDMKYFTLCVSIILVNAIQHSSPNSKITLSGSTSDHLYSLSIKDEGNGFPDLLLQKGIKAFISTHVDGNPGLELYLSKLIAENHQGHLNIRNDNGAVVEVQLPLN